MKIISFVNILFLGALFSQTPLYYPGFPQIIDSTNMPSLYNDLPLITDLENDLQKEIILTTEGSKLYVIRSDGSNLSGFPIMISDVICGFASGDIDGNGLLEIIVRTRSQILAIDKWGNSLSGFPVTYYDNTTNPVKIFEFI
ncbi:MAG: hypothetical protein UZ05_CHB002002847 [Chlorobi bacterium OLB5]|nr:MAG: hypothetical protein UZ05_CHB002002847 [Chlorobi bacterium OLB5]